MTFSFVRRAAAGVSAVALAFASCSCVGESKVPPGPTVIEDGVWKWRTTGRPVVLFGVNYNAPFCHDFEGIRRRGLDARKAVDEDLRHLRRLGLDFIRLHAFDVEIADGEGNLADNERLELLDYLVYRAGCEGLRLALTPIAWWKSKGGCRRAFSYRWKMTEMTSDPVAREVQCRYLRAFVSHVNRFNSLRYGDDPAVVAFEPINEPHYRVGFSDAGVTAYVDALVRAIRETGTDRPVFFNSWQGRDAAVAASEADGLSGSAYPMGISSGAGVFGNALGLVSGSTLALARRRCRKPLMIYEYDASEIQTAYLHPALALRFRSEGVQAVAQFHYDMCALADENASWPSHFLNLVYTPRIAMSMAIAAEAMRRVPAGTPCPRTNTVIVSGPLRIDAPRDAAVLADDDCYLSSGDVCIRPSAPATLKRIWGCGVSPIVSTDGNGCYFLDRVSPGTWRLQLYPNVRELADPFSRTPGKKVAVTSAPIRLKLEVPGLGSGYCVRTRDGARVVTTAREGRVTLSAGDYLLVGSDRLDAGTVAAAAALDVPSYSAPAATQPPAVASRRADELERRRAAFARLADARDWSFLEPAREARRGASDPYVLGTRRLVKDDRGHAALWFGATNFADRTTLSARFFVDGEGFGRKFPSLATATNAAWTVRARSGQKETTRIEMCFQTWDGVTYVCDVPLTEDWREIRMPLCDFRVAGWSEVKTPSAPVAVASVCRMGFTLGRWLRAGDPLGAQNVEISEVGLSGE